jgi:hypothetical protein
MKVQEYKNRMTTINKKKDKFQIQMWIEELKSWLVFDNFKSKAHAQEFLDDEKEREDIEKYVVEELKNQSKFKSEVKDNVKKRLEEKEKEASISDTNDAEKIEE